MLSYGMPVRAVDRPVNWPTLGGLIVALLEAQARLIREVSAWAR